MSKRNKSLEKEGFEWRVKFEKCNRALLDMATDKQAQDAYVAKSSRQIAQLQKLCRTLQAERATFIEVLTANNIERPAMPELPPLPTDIEPPPKSADKLDIMSRNCMELKKSLAQLQGQMNALSVDKPEPKKEESSAAKKNKNKKANKKSAKDRPVVPSTDDKVAEVEVVTLDPVDPQPAAALPPINPEALLTETKPIEITTDKANIELIVPEPVAEPTEEAISVDAAASAEITTSV